MTLPEVEARTNMIQKLIPNNKSLDYVQLASQMPDYSGSDIKLVCKEAAMKPLRRLLTEIDKNEMDPKYKNFNYDHGINLFSYFYFVFYVHRII